jgi:hypothetical protein
LFEEKLSNSEYNAKPSLKINSPSTSSTRVALLLLRAKSICEDPFDSSASKSLNEMLLNLLAGLYSFMDKFLMLPVKAYIVLFFNDE